MKFFSLIFFLTGALIFWGPATAQAEDASPKSASFLSQDQLIQKTVKELCAYQDRIVFTGHFFNHAVVEVRNDVHLTLENFQDVFLSRRIKTGGLTKYMNDFIQSDAFLSEMHNCEPDMDRRNQMVLHAILADVAGQVTGLSQIGLSMWGFVKVVKYLGIATYSIYAKVATGLQVNALVARETFLKYFENIVTSAPPALVALYTLAQSDRMSQQPIDEVKVRSDLDLKKQKIRFLQNKLPNYQDDEAKRCVLENLIYENAQEYFNYLANLKAQGASLSVLSGHWEFRYQIARLKPCKAQ